MKAIIELDVPDYQIGQEVSIYFKDTMMIKAIVQESCDDVISRRDAIKKFTYNYKGQRIPDYDCDNWPIQIDIKTVKEILRDLPPVTPQQKIGYWTRELIRNEKGGCIGAKMICSGCSNDNKHDEYMNHCPNVKSLIDDKEPQYESRRTDEEIELGLDIGDEVVGDFGAKGIVVGIDTHEGDVVLSLLMKNHKVPQLVKASSYKTKTGRHFPQIVEVLDAILP